MDTSQTISGSRMICNCSAAAVMLLCSASEAAIVASASSNGGVPFVVATDDLLQTQLLSSTISGFTAVAAYAPDLPNGGTLADGAYNSGGHAFGDAYIDSSTGDPWSATFNLNTTVNVYGYDITSIQSISGWDSQLAGQDFTIEYSLVGSDLFISLGRFTYAADNVAFKVALSENVTGVLAAGVDAIRFTHHTTSGGGRGSYRELDVFGVPTTVPEPSAAILVPVSLFGCVLLRRRRNV